MTTTINRLKIKPRRRAGRRNDTRALILQSALEVFSQGTYEKSNIRTIAKQAKVGLGSIYRHFESKEDLLISVMLMLIDEIVAKLQPACARADGTFNKIDVFLYTTFDYFQADIRVGSLLFLVGPLRTVLATPAYQKSQWTRMLIDIFREGQASNEVRSDINATIMMDTVYALLQRHFQTWVILKRPKQLTSIVSQITEIIYSAFKKGAEDDIWAKNEKYKASSAQCL